MSVRGEGVAAEGADAHHTGWHAVDADAIGGWEGHRMSLSCDGVQRVEMVIAKDAPSPYQGLGSIRLGFVGTAHPCK